MPSNRVKRTTWCGGIFLFVSFLTWEEQDFSKNRRFVLGGWRCQEYYAQASMSHLALKKDANVIFYFPFVLMKLLRLIRKNWITNAKFHGIDLRTLKLCGCLPGLCFPNKKWVVNISTHTTWPVPMFSIVIQMSKLGIFHMYTILPCMDQSLHKKKIVNVCSIFWLQSWKDY